MIAKRRAPDGRVYERLTEPDENGIETPVKRLVQLDDIHWCGPDGPGLVTPSTPPHICPIWKLSDDQNWTEPEPAPQSLTVSIDDLIRRVLPPSDSLLDSEDMGRINTLALLYQARELQRVGNLLCELVTIHSAAYLEDKAPVYARQPDFETCETRSVCSMCNHGEHARCIYPEPSDLPIMQCQCPICHQAPPPELNDPGLHSFEGLEDNHFCTKCGGGRLHRIHQQ